MIIEEKKKHFQINKNVKQNNAIPQRINLTPNLTPVF